MSKTSKILLAGLILLIAGAIVFALGFSAFGFSFRSLLGQAHSNNNLPITILRTPTTYTPHSEITQIDLEDHLTQLVVLPSTDGLLHVEVYEGEHFNYHFSEENGVLTVKCDYAPIGFNFSLINGATTIYCPENVKVINARTSNASAKAENLELDSLYLKSSNGAISVKGLSISGNAELESSNARIIVENSTFGDLTVKTANGRIEADCRCRDTLSLKTSNGSITVSGIAAQREIRLETSNGSIKGTVAGSIMDYTISSHTSLGDSTLPTSFKGGDTVLEVKTSNGSIALDFLK